MSNCRFGSSTAQTLMSTDSTNVFGWIRDILEMGCEAVAILIKACQALFYSYYYYKPIISNILLAVVTVVVCVLSDWLTIGHAECQLISLKILFYLCL